MIPFASQRGGGQDLATHLMNEHDNEYMELATLHGAIAQDLQGAFAEWEAQAKALTKCRQYLCSLSVSPDELQGRITRAQYLDYIARAESKLGLGGQPRAVIFHIKQDEQGRMREHCHVVWSRIDVEKGKAVNLSFFKEKLMTVTREFARDHGLELPEGYYRREDEFRRNRQLSSYDSIKQKETGITHEQRMAVITGAWHRSDNGRAFVNALEDSGYILARGRNKTRVVLVDIYGHTTALTRLIDDPVARAKHVREFLGADYAPDKLPSVEQAQERAAQHRAAIEAFEKARFEGEQALSLIKRQAQRRAKAEQQAAHLTQVQHQEWQQFAGQQKDERQQLKANYLAESERIRIERAQRRPKGLAAFLGCVTGVSLITKKLHEYRERRRYEAYLGQRAALKQRQQSAREDLVRRQELQAAELRRRLRALDQIERKERASAEQALRKDGRQRINARHAHMPKFTMELTPPGRKAAPHKAKQRHISPVARELAKAAQDRMEPRQVKLTEEFKRASGSDGRGEGEGGDGRTEGPKPASEQKQARQERRKQRQDRKKNRQDKGEQTKAKERDQEQERKRQRRRRRKRDLDRGM